ncbi:hypothetical protein HDE_00516 [Halotydeus destructor]|nr:hypothetical protein HDE_00516 [Halotydeus destructor]
MKCFLVLAHVFVAASLDFQVKPPIVWIESERQLLLEKYAVSTAVTLQNPCNVFQDIRLPMPHSDANLFTWCDAKFDANVRKPMQQLCSSTVTKPEKNSRYIFASNMIPKQLYISATLTTGLHAFSVATEFYNSSFIQNITDQHRHLLDQLILTDNKQVYVESLVELERDRIAGRPHTQQADMLQINDAFAQLRPVIDDIVSGMSSAKSIIVESTNAWEQGRIASPLLGLLHIELPCLGKCPKNLFVPKLCSSSSYDTFNIVFDAPVIEGHKKMVIAEPFSIQHSWVRNGLEQHCKWEYSGPTAILVDPIRQELCEIQFVNNQQSSDIIMPQTCHFQRSNLSDIFEIFCRSDRTVVKPQPRIVTTDVGHYVYSPFSTVRSDGTSFTCPNHVFFVPISTHFQMDNTFYPKRSASSLLGHDYSIYINSQLITSGDFLELPKYKTKGDQLSGLAAIILAFVASMTVFAISAACRQIVRNTGVLQITPN